MDNIFIDKCNNLTYNCITEEDVDNVESEIGMGRLAWDMVDHKELILTCFKVLLQKIKDERNATKI